MQNFFQILIVEVAEGNIAIVVQATGHNRAVTKNAQLVTESVTEQLPCILRGLQIRPVEFFAVLQIDLVPYPLTVAFLFPRLGKTGGHCSEDFGIFRICTTLIPQPVNHQFFTLSGLSEPKTVLQIGFKGHRKIIGLKGVEGDIDFMEGRMGK